MLKERKISSNWNIAAVHYLISGLIVPVLAVFVIGIPISLLIGDQFPVLHSFLISVVLFLSIWLGCMFSAKYIAKTFVVSNSEKVVKLATIYFILIGGIYRLYGIIMNPGIDMARGMDLISFAASVLLFYIWSKKYLKNTAEFHQTTVPASYI